MTGIKVKQIDSNSADVYAFRREIICTDEKSDERFLIDDIPYSKEFPEEVWKFSKKKWESIEFDGLFGVYYNGELAAISGSKLYGHNKEYLRIGMMYYVLKKFRVSVRSTLWRPGGMISAALDYHKARGPIKYSFVSIYPHNSKLVALCAAISRGTGMGQIGSGGAHINIMKSFTVYDRPIQFNNVPQHILYRSEDTDVENIDIMINTLDEIAQRNL